MRVSELYLFSFIAEEATHYVDISGAPLQRKVASFQAHQSQYQDPNDVAKMLVTLAATVAQSTPVKAAETFQAFF